jgi:hypothetical protein
MIGEARELDAALDGLIERFGQGPWQEDAVRARAEYAERTGRVFEEDEIYEARTVAFLEWYVCERPLTGRGQTPAEIALAEADSPALRAWARSHRSLFRVAHIGETSVELVDLWGGARFAVDERRRLHGVAAGDVVEARLVGWRGRVRFGRTFGFHPAAARPALVELVGAVRARGGRRVDAVDEAAQRQVRALRFQHVEPERVYAAGFRDK